jgi:hypothetical protein
VGGAALASLLVLGGVTFGAYTALSGGGAQPSEAIPSTAIAYARIDLDPSAGQKVDLLRLLRKVPEFEESTGISSDKTDLRELIAEKALPALGCDLAYEDDFEPWLGDRAGFAAVPVDDTVTPVIAVQVTDEEAAREAVGAFEKCAEENGGSLASMGMDDEFAEHPESGDDAPGFDFVGDYMVITEKQHLTAMVDQTEKSSLADNDTFGSDMDALGEQGVLSYWYDVDAMREIAGFEAELQESGMAELYDGLHSSYGAVRAGDDYIEMFTSARTDHELSDARTPVDELPESTMVAASFSGGGDLVDTYWGSFEEFMDTASGGYADQELDDFEAETGLSLPDDLITVFGDSLTFSMSPDGMDPETLAAEDPARLDFGARFVTDTEELESIIGKVEEYAGDEFAPIDLVTSEADDGLVMASNQGYADEIADGGSLGDSDTFTTAVPSADDSVGVFYVDLDMVRDVVAGFDEEDAADEALRYLDPFEAAGFSVVQNDGSIDTVLRLTFD